MNLFLPNDTLIKRRAKKATSEGTPLRAYITADPVTHAPITQDKASSPSIYSPTSTPLPSPKAIPNIPSPNSIPLADTLAPPLIPI